MTVRTANAIWHDLVILTGRYGLSLVRVADDQPIPGSYWGEPEAGLLRQRVFARGDTPVHSVLHETAHAVCMPLDRRRRLDTDAGGDDLEECAVCYLQVLWARDLYGQDLDAVFCDMDAWGYSFRLGSARAWFEQDADDARAWLQDRGLVNQNVRPTQAARA